MLIDDGDDEDPDENRNMGEEAQEGKEEEALGVNDKNFLEM